MEALASVCVRCGGGGEGQTVRSPGMSASPAPFRQQPGHRTRDCAHIPPQTRAPLSCPPRGGPPAHPLHTVSLTLLGTPCVPLGPVYCPGGFLLLWLLCLHPVRSHPHAAFL